MNVREEISADDSVRVEVGKRIRERCETLDLSQAQLGKLLRTSKGKPVPGTHVARWMRGVNLPQRRYWPQLADALQMSIEGLFGDLIPSETGDLLLNRVEALEARLDSVIHLLQLGDAVAVATRARRHLDPGRLEEAAEALAEETERSEEEARATGS